MNVREGYKLAIADLATLAGYEADLEKAKALEAAHFALSAVYESLVEAEPVYEYAIDGVQDRKAKVIMPRTVEDILAYAARYTNPPRKVYRRTIGEWEEVK